MKKINSTLKEVLKNSKPDLEEVKETEKEVREFIRKIEIKIKSLKLGAEVFVGGSFAKGTMIKKNVYDIDVFIRFDMKYADKISSMTERILKGFKKKKVHGSRDYFKITNKKNSFFFEVVPVLKIKNPREAKNITDLSFFHVNYARKKLKKNMLDEIILAKTFCHAINCYGAESYIKGFSGYALELFIVHYKDFLKFIREMAKLNIKEKKVIDMEKKFKSKQEVLMNMNSSKLQSPIILVDPTYKERNVLASLSEETFLKFQKACKDFLKKPGSRFFEKKEINFERAKKDAKKKKLDFVMIRLETEKQEGDIAGSKLLKFYNHINDEISKLFIIKNKEFEYNEGKDAVTYFTAKKKRKIISQGPKIGDEKNVQKFKKTHGKTFTKSGRIYSEKKIKINLGKFLENWNRKNKKKMKEMSVKKLEIIG